MKLRILFLSALTAISLQAHPGHAPFSEGTKHFISSPNHVAWAILVSVALCAVAKVLKNRSYRVVLRAVSALIAIIAVIS
jgi:hypothetical protein